jgi:hypothetical protein
MSPHRLEFVGTGSTTPIPPGKGPPEEPSLASMVPAHAPALNIILRGRLRLCVMNRRQRRVKAGQPRRRPIASKPSSAGISNMAWLLGELTLLLMVIHMASTVLGAAHSSDIIGDGHPPSGEDYSECPRTVGYQSCLLPSPTHQMSPPSPAYPPPPPRLSRRRVIPCCVTTRPMATSQTAYPASHVRGRVPPCRRSTRPRRSSGRGGSCPLLPVTSLVSLRLIQGMCHSPQA